MNPKFPQTEELFLKLFKFVILAVMTLTLIVTVGALVFSAYQYTQSPKAPEPAQKAPGKSVNVEEFLKQLETRPPQEEAPAEEEPKTEPPAKPDPIKYGEQAKKIFACLRDSNKKSNIAAINTSDEAVENFRRQFQRVADFKNADRGQPYVDDAVKVTCEILLHAKVVDYRKSHQTIDFFYDVVNFHIKAWDALKQEAKTFEEEEQARVAREERAEELRVAMSKQAARETLWIAGGAFLLFMALALYLIISAIESNLRRISVCMESSGIKQPGNDAG